MLYAKVITNGQYLGLVRTKSGLIFSTGNGIWTTVELETVETDGYQITVIKGLQFNKQESPFKRICRRIVKVKRYPYRKSQKSS